jgi:hypothetical protein
MFDEQVEFTLQSTGLDLVSSSELNSETTKLLKLSGSDITNMSSTKLSETIFNTARYMMYVQLYYNQVNANLIYLKKEHEQALVRFCTNIKEGKTIKEKSVHALSQNTALSEQDQTIKQLEISVNILNNLPEMLMELTNALKKELQRRQTTFERNLGS